ncbi:MAG: DNA methyltransferase [Methanosarcina sp.]|nr:DNA methyltransferase [Methanosarcina sp.]MDD3872964.1 DNA methyltransferase [Methanosarcina sp.]MDD4522315.1 DNA methyltransferase [Methanosarcina sp.]
MSEQRTLGFDYDQPVRVNSDQIVCLGITFENDEERRNYFTEKLREKLQDPEFRKIEGFPIGSDEDILALSDPPYYTACPNPWIANFIEEWEGQKPEKPADYKYHREPFAADVSEGKNDPIYNAHSYHTKVPHKAIMRYILHYTEPGDIVFDGFCGTGMTGVAAQMCGDRKTVESLGYQVKPDGTIMQQETDEDGKTHWVPFSKLGVRRAVLNDLSPAATFIAYNYNTPVDVKAFEREAKSILKEVEEECGWMYATVHKEPRMNTDEHRWNERLIRVNPCPSVVEDNPDLTFGKINYTVWSDVFVCPECTGEVVFWEAAVDKEAGKVNDEFPCPHCSAKLTKRNMDRAWVTKYDSAIKETIRQAKQVPVLINYSVGKKRHEKRPDEFDFALIEKVENSEIPYWFPTAELPDGYNTRQPKGSHGITHVHHFYTKRNLWVLAAVLKRLQESDSRYMAWYTSTLSWVGRELRLHLGNYFGGGGGVITSLRGTLYVASLSVETNVLERLGLRIRWQAFRHNLENGAEITETCSASAVSIFDESCDYIFLDPPFGSNLNYSELNSLLENWIKVVTNNSPEAIENSVQKKGLPEYRVLMTACFKEAHRILKPGRWMTVEFSNTKASVWNNIQTALTDAGFLVANVSALDKKKGSFKACTTPTAVKQDLVISAYKPNGGFEKRFQEKATTEEGVWDFVRTHLDYLPVIKKQGVLLQMVPERDPRILFDQMIAYYIRKGYPVPISSQEFQLGLSQRFIERDGMYFLPEQVAEYDRKKMTKQVFQAKLFVSDEASAIQWLRQLLKEKPQTFQDIHPQFIQETQRAWNKNEAPLELSTLLEQNFLRYDGKSPVPEQIHAYLSSNWKDMRNLDKEDPKLVTKAKDRWYVPDPNKAGDLEKLRERSLLKEFEEYRQAKKKLRIFRLEAVRAGFKKAWQERDYGTIIGVAEKIPNSVLEEDPKLLMWYDQAVTRMGSE